MKSAIRLEHSLSKRVLICVDWFDPATRAGGPIRSCVNLVRLLHRDCEISVLTGDRDLGADQVYSGVQIGEWNNWNDQATVLYATRQQHATGAFLRAVRKIRPGTIYLNGMFSLFGAIVPLLSRRVLPANTRFVVAPRGMLKPSALSKKRWKKTLWLRFLRMLGIADRVLFHATSELEADEVRAVFGNTAKIQIVPNIPCLPVECLPSSAKQAGKLRLSFAGRVHPIKNLLYLLRLLKSVQFECSLNVIGPIEDIEYERECRDMISEFPGNVTVVFSGAVTNEDVVRLVADSDLMVLPTLGENFGHSIFEALSRGIPVLISDQTYWRNLDADHSGWDLDLSRPNDFSAALEMMAQMGNTEYQTWQQGAHQRAVRFFEKNDLKTAYLDLLAAQFTG